MKVLELFAGSRSIWKVCDDLWCEVFSTDLYQLEKINLSKDILDFNIDDVPFIPDVIWASPPCTWFSVAAIGKNWVKWEECTPKTDSARLWIKILDRSFFLIKEFQKLNPNLIFFIENPRWKMRKAPQLKNFGRRETVTYCQYWYSYMKPTDIWTNSKSWIPKKMCKNWMPCHQSAPRGSKTWVQWLKWDYLRSMIPEELCIEIIWSTKNLWN